MITLKRLVKPLGGLAISASLFAATQGFAETSMQCSQKMHSVLYGRSATAAELQIANPMGNLDNMIKNTEFVERFSRYVNKHMNWLPGSGKSGNPTYQAMRQYLFNAREPEKPWEQLFTGGFETYDGGYNRSESASGYFSNREWKKVYKGNEEDGYKLRTAYLILNNQIGLNLEALTVNNAGGSGIKSRQDPSTVCYTCHFATEFALDRIAAILPRVDRKNSDAQNLLELPPPGPSPQTIYGNTVTDLKSLTKTLAKLDEFNNNACHVAFKFVFGRDERGADKELFQQCVTEFKNSGGYITSAIKHFVESPIFCKSEG
jgi:hypothetical protein